MPEKRFPPSRSRQRDRLENKVLFSFRPAVESRGSNNGTFVLGGVLVAMLLVRLIFGP